MMVGHSLLVFAAVAITAHRLDFSRNRALTLALLAAAFAAIPDVDMVYALFGALDSGFTGVWSTVNGFWAASTVTHRGITHSLVFAVPASLAFGLMASQKPVFRVASTAGLGLIVAAAGLLGGWIPAAVMLLFVVCGGFTAYVAGNHGVGAPMTAGLAFLGLASHPFGDVFTGEPPAFLYPVDVSLLSERVVLIGEPTLNLISVFLLELLVIWLAVLVYGDLTGRNYLDAVDYRLALGVGYAAAVLVLPPPTLQESYHFVFSVLGLGVVGAVPTDWGWGWPDPYRAAVTGLGVVTVALLAYTAVYVVV